MGFIILCIKQQVDQSFGFEVCSNTVILVECNIMVRINLNSSL